MSKSIQEKTINKNKYQLHMLGALKAFTIGRGLTKLMPVAGSFMDAQFSNALDGLKFSTIATVLLENLEELDIDDILEEVVYSKLICNGQDINADEHFKGNLGEMVDVIAWALEVNFKSLFLGSTLVSKMFKQLKGMGILPQMAQQEVQEEVVESEEE